MRAHRALIATAAALGLVANAEAWPGRDGSARAQFQRANPCPVNGHKSGACPGYEIDHIVPLKCRGADSLENMQWLTIAEHKAKTKREAKDCRK